MGAYCSKPERDIMEAQGNENDSSTKGHVEATARSNGFEALTRINAKYQSPGQKTAGNAIQAPEQDAAGEGPLESNYPAKPASLLGLPGELRNRIYYFIYCASWRLRSNHTLGPPSPDRQVNFANRGFLGLTQVCRQLREEFLPLYARENDITIQLHDIEQFVHHMFPNPNYKIYQNCHLSIILDIVPRRETIGSDMDEDWVANTERQPGTDILPLLKLVRTVPVITCQTVMNLWPSYPHVEFPQEFQGLVKNFREHIMESKNIFWVDYTNTQFSHVVVQYETADNTETDFFACIELQIKREKMRLYRHLLVGERDKDLVDTLQEVESRNLLDKIGLEDGIFWSVRIGKLIREGGPIWRNW